MLGRAEKKNIQNWLETLNSFNSTPEFGTTRVLFTEPELEGRAYMKEEMRKIGLEVHEDSIGNIFGVLKGSNPELAPVWTGSHIDTVLNGGMFDGMTGVVGGMEALRIIKESQCVHQRNIVVVIYTSEEPTRFGLCCLGSRAMAGKLQLEDTKRIFDKEGRSLYEVLKALGYCLEDFDKIPVRKGEVYASIEMHIEQSISLEKNNCPIGIVKAICAPTNFQVEITGKQSHAGGTSMADRIDAYAAACEFGLAVERIAKESSSEYTTGTVGKVEVIPNSSNVIPGRVIFTIDIRDCDFASKNIIIEKLEREAARLEAERGVCVKMKMENHDIPIQCDENIIKKLEAACEKLNVKYMKTISGAYHDSLFVGEFAPAAMIFVPSKAGISHSPEEWSDYDDIACGVDILAESLYNLSNEV